MEDHKRNAWLAGILLVTGAGLGIWLFAEFQGGDEGLKMVVPSNETQVPSNQAANVSPQPTQVNADTKNVSGQISYVEGVVEARLSADAEWQAVTKATLFVNGMELKTAANSKAAITFADGSIARVDQNTGLQFESQENAAAFLLSEGRIFNHVVKGSGKSYIVSAGGYAVTALGTVFDVEKRGTVAPKVTVLESQVSVRDAAGKQLGTVGEKKKAALVAAGIKEESITDVDLKAPFLSWSLQQEKLKVVLDEATADDDADETKGAITLSGKKTDNGVKLSWKLSDLDAPNGFKVVKSTDKDPKYPGDDAQLVSNKSATSYEWKVADGKTYHFRVCIYASGKCGIYSNDISVQAPKKEENNEDYADEVSLQVEKAGSDSVKLTWDISGGEAPKGFKLVTSQKADPTYPLRDTKDDKYYYVTDSKKDTYTWKSSYFESGKTYHFRVCVYDGSKCKTYSDDESVAL